MRQFTECLACSCLIDARDPACPFCGARTPRSSTAPAWAALSFAIGLGLANASCGPKGDDADDTTVSASETQTTPSNPGEETTFDNDTPDGVTYAGPDDESWTIDSTGPIPDPSTTTTTSDDSFPDASTYAGPDETWGTDPLPPDTDTDTDSSSTSSSSSSSSSSSTSDGESTTEDPDSDSADASTYGGPDSFGTTGTSG